MRRFLTLLSEHDREHRLAMDQWARVAATLPDGSQTDLADGLTICSVAYQARFCLEHNVRLTAALNPDAQWSWLVFDNNTELREMMPDQLPGVTVVRPERRMGVLGYEHALAITALLPSIRTRFAVFLDPDCFIVSPGWARLAPQYMQRRDLQFFGTPINPRRHNSYRYFPYMVCMFVDLAKVSRRDLCFVPDVWSWPVALNYVCRQALTRIPKAGYAFRWLLTEQWKTNGWRIKERFGDSRSVKYECVQPVWDVNDTIPPGTLKRLIHSLTPASVAPVPKQRGYCSPIGFAHMGAPDVAARGWEEFVWQNRPFAFHVGSVHARLGRYEAGLDELVRRFADAAPVPVADSAL